MGHGYSYEKDIICSECGAKYKLYSMKIPMRDKDSERCEICGATLISWNGAIMYDARLIEKGDNK